jgi:hypothetical protein
VGGRFLGHLEILRGPGEEEVLGYQGLKTRESDPRDYWASVSRAKQRHVCVFSL